MSRSVKSLHTVIENISRYEGKALDKVVEAVEVTQHQLASYARQTAPFRDQTGNLRKSIQPGRIQVENARVRGEVEARQEYASHVEFVSGGRYAFMRPSIEAFRGRFNKRVRIALQKIRHL